MASFEVRVRVTDGPGHALRLGPTALRIGRGPANDLVLDDDTVSWHHAELYVEGDTAWVRDLGSRNGVWIGPERIRQPTSLPAAAIVRLGARLEVEVLPAPEVTAAPILHIEELPGGVRFLIRGDRFLIGSDSSCDLRLTEGPGRAATISVLGPTEIHVGTDEAEFPVALGSEFTVAGRRLRVVESRDAQAPTVEFHAATYPYAVDALLDGPTGPQARLSDPEGHRELLLTGNRGVLLLTLARQLVRDREAGRPESEEGWISDADVATAIWGATGRDANNLHVLVYRLRKQLQAEGFDPWFIEKRHWGLRARLQRVTVG